MASIHVREVPDETLTTLKVRAARAGQSLQAYVRQLLIGEADTLTPEEFAEEARSIASRGSVTEDDILAAINDTRETRAA
ncbi:FitA-like ribbon-helix-helix domain-containing protein [Streptomyces sp. MAR4 CNX-425]|uniref:FitA-like ribbon-helix-helix domain-containing protein n=1 Tax=Streptomyces sp. MAR4 CNX-425 TaxID=3406343 RepID=UPI003B5076AA